MDKAGSVLGLIGLGAMAVGFWWAWPPLALILGGSVLVLAAVTLEAPASSSRSRRTEADSKPAEWNGSL